MNLQTAIVTLQQLLEHGKKVQPGDAREAVQLGKESLERIVTARTQEHHENFFHLNSETD